MVYNGRVINCLPVSYSPFMNELTKWFTSNSYVIEIQQIKPLIQYFI